MKLFVHHAFTHEGVPYEPGAVLEVDESEALRLRDSAALAGGMTVRTLEQLFSLPSEPGCLAVLKPSTGLYHLVTHVRNVIRLNSEMPETAEPFIFRDRHVAQMPAEMPLLEACEFQIRNYPGMRPGWSCPELNLVRLQHAIQFPSWAYHVKGVRDCKFTEHTWMYEGADTTPQGMAFAIALEQYTIRVAIQNFFMSLAEGRLSVRGVAEKDIFEDAMMLVPAGWWTRDVILDVRQAELKELQDGKWVRRFSRLMIDTPAVKKTVDATAKAIAWLKERPTITRDDARTGLKAAYPSLSNNGFEEAWRVSAPSEGRKPGRKPPT